jgi:MoaA/NifB/PqqE/SkfB family radical SAM enzyme
MNKKIVKLTPTELDFAVTWMLHKRCNNDCMYCGEEHHNDSSSVLTLEELKSYWIQIFEKTKHVELPYVIAFTGGEPIINKDFKPFVAWLDKNYSPYIKKIGVTTNGSGSKKYYLELFKHLTFMTISTHSESFSFDFERFCETIIACNQYAASTPGKIFFVNIMEEYWAVDLIKKLIDVCQENNIKFSLNAIGWNRRGARSYPILIQNRTKIHKTELTVSPEIVNLAHKEIQDYVQLYSIPKDEHYNVEVEYDDGSSIKTFATRLNFLDLNYFKDWECYAGYHRISINDDSSVYVGECKGQFLGKLSDSSFKLLDGPCTCSRIRCTGNPMDLMLAKSIKNKVS